MGGKRHWPQGAFFFSSPKSVGLPILWGAQSSACVPAVSWGPQAWSLTAWGHAIHWGASSARVWGRMAIPERGVMGQGEALLGCTEEDVRQERRQNEEQAKKVRSKTVPSKDG